MSNIVVYESKYGSTAKYAKWIGEELKCKVARISDVSIEELKNYDNIIFGSWIHAGKLEGFKNLSNNIDILKDKNILVFAVGLSETEDKSYQQFKELNFKNFKKLKSYYFRGAFHFKNLAFIDKTKMRMFKIILKRQKVEKKNEETIGMMRNSAEAVDYTNKEAIEEIVKMARILNL